jgi:TnpA family transposase
LVDAFIYHIKKYDETTTNKADKQFVKNEEDLQIKIAQLILLYVDEKYINNTILFNEVCKHAFTIMPQALIKTVGLKMLNKPKLKRELKWHEIDKIKRNYKKSLRPLLMKISFSSEYSTNPWFQAAIWLQNIFAQHKKLSDRPFSECPIHTIPNYQKDFLLTTNTKDNKTINSDRYEYWIYRQINKQLASGGLYVENSFNHRCFNQELAPIEQNQDILAKLNISWLKKPVAQHIEDLSKKLDKLWNEFNTGLKQEKFKHLKYDYKKRRLDWHKVKNINNEKVQKKFYKQVPFCDISDIMHFVDQSCGFLSAFTPLQPRHSKQLLDKNVLIATILAQAFNYGNYKMSQTSDIPYSALETTHQQYLRLATLKAANDIISNAIGKLKIFEYYSFDLELLYSSVDGQKYELDTPNIIGRRSKKYLREGPGVTAYTLSANHIPIQCELIGSHEHESYYVFDIWYNNSSDIQPDVITGDMHSINKANFAILYCFGVQFKPRFTSLNDQSKNIYCTSDISKYSNFIIKPKEKINSKIIIDNEVNLKQLIATLGLKEITQANLIKKLCHLPPENNLRKLVFELDKLVRSVYTLEYLMDHQLQKNVQKAQNRIESYHQLRAAIAKIGGKKELYGKTDIDVAISNETNRLAANAIILFNSAILSEFVEINENIKNPEKFLAIIKKISPVSWHYHIHFSGQYTFKNKAHIINIKDMIKNAILNI